NSRSATAAPATCARTGPAPIAPHGFVVRRQRAAPPPVASTVARAPTAPASVTTPAQRLPSLHRATAEASSSTSTPGLAATSSAAPPPPTATSVSDEAKPAPAEALTTDTVGAHGALHGPSLVVRARHWRSPGERGAPARDRGNARARRLGGAAAGRGSGRDAR